MTIWEHERLDGHQPRLPGQRPVPDADRISDLLDDGVSVAELASRYGYNVRWVMSARLLQP